MNVTLRLTAEVERKLKEEAARNGVTVDAYIERLAEEAVSSIQVPPSPSAQNWENQWRAWAASHKALPSVADDDREGIYAGRGE